MKEWGRSCRSVQLFCLKSDRSVFGSRAKHLTTDQTRLWLISTVVMFVYMDSFILLQVTLFDWVQTNPLKGYKEGLKHHSRNWDSSPNLVSLTLHQQGICAQRISSLFCGSSSVNPEMVLLGKSCLVSSFSNAPTSTSDSNSHAINHLSSPFSVELKKVILPVSASAMGCCVLC